MTEKKKPAALETLGSEVQTGSEGQGVNALPGRLSDMRKDMQGLCKCVTS